MGDPAEAGAEAVEGAGEGAAEKPMRMTHRQMTEMVRSGGFSSGFTSYKAFRQAAKNTPEQTKRSTPHAMPTLKSLDTKRGAFYDRRASQFGVTLMTSSDKEHWQSSTRGLGSRSSSDGALVRFTDQSVTNITRTVYSELGVDVRTTDRSRIRRPSFTENLDVYGVSPDPKLPTSATGQAVHKLFNSTAPPDVFAAVKSADDGGNKKGGRHSSLQSAGKLASRR